MRPLLAGLLVLFCVETSAAKTHVTFRVHAQANEQDGEPFSMQVPSQSLRRSVTIEKMASISEREVQAFYPYRSATGSLGALVQLDDHGRLWLDTLSIEHRGSLLFIFVNGRNARYIFCICTKNNKDQSWEANNEAWILTRKLSKMLWERFE